ncbi:MAG: hypothetical protein ACREBE_02065, partial [bacterium]
MAQLSGVGRNEWFLIRSASRLTPPLDTGGQWRVGVLVPEARAVRNSTLPYSLNDGSLWAGRGWSASLTAGVSARLGVARLIIAPTLVSEQNSDFQVIPYPRDSVPLRSPW